jgi:hypothetical protein
VVTGLFNLKMLIAMGYKGSVGSFNTLKLRGLSEVRSLLRLKSRAPAVKRFLTHF